MFKTENYELTEQKKPYETDQLKKENEDKLWKGIISTLPIEILSIHL